MSEKVLMKGNEAIAEAAIKAGWNTTKAEMQSLAEKVLRNDDIMYCPHGRPVAFEIKKKELEKQVAMITRYNEEL